MGVEDEGGGQGSGGEQCGRGRRDETLMTSATVRWSTGELEVEGEQRIGSLSERVGGRDGEDGLEEGRGGSAHLLVQFTSCQCSCGGDILCM